MEAIKRYRSFLLVAVSLAVYYIVLYVFHWPTSYLIAIYAVGIAAACFFMRAGLLAGVANMYYQRGKREKARAMYERSFRNKVKNPAVFLNYAVMRLHDGDAEIALNYAQKSLELKPDIMAEKNINLTIGSCYWMLGEIDKAVAHLEGMVSKYDYVNAHVLTTLGYLYILAGDLDKAKATSEKAIEDTPDSGAAWDNMGQIYLAQGDLDNAEKAFKKAISFRDNLVDSHYLLGTIYEKRNDVASAREAFMRAYSCKVSSLNTVTKEQVMEKYTQYKDRYGDDEDAEEQEN